MKKKNKKVYDDKWYNKSLSDRLNIPDNNFKENDCHINFGLQEHDDKYSKHYSFDTKTNLFNCVDQNTIIANNLITDINKMKTKIHNINHIKNLSIHSKDAIKVLEKEKKPVDKNSVESWNCYDPKFANKMKKEKNRLKNEAKRLETSTRRIKKLKVHYKSATETIEKSINKDLQHKKIDNFFEKIKKGINTIKMAPKTTITKIIKMLPTEEQQIMIQQWFDECIKLYNKCVDKYGQDSKYFDGDIGAIKVKFLEEVYGDREKPCPYAILGDEIRIFCSNLKSCNTNVNNGNYKSFKMTHKKENKGNNCINVQKQSITTSGDIYKTLLGTMKYVDKLPIIECDCKINYIKELKRYELIVPVKIDIKRVKKREKIVALDPGEKVFMSYFSENTFGNIGDNVRIIILKIQRKIKKLQNILSKDENGKILNKEGKKLKNKKNIKRAIRRHYKKINNIVKELHNKTALFLCKKYDKILIPKFETQNMVKKRMKEILDKEGVKVKDIRAREEELKGTVKFVLLRLSHYKFRQHLTHKGAEYGCEIKVVEEHDTSITCTKCGHKSKRYDYRKKQCDNCKYELDRDITGSRNILIKNAKLVASINGYDVPNNRHYL